MSAVGAVRQYVAALREIRGRLFAALPAVADVREVLAAVNQYRTMPRVGRSASGIEYSVHGVGCRMTDEDGREVDVDLMADPQYPTAVMEVFDAWRIWCFRSSIGDESLTDKELKAACVELAARGELREFGNGRWFALPS
jgi:hypothetical protein